MPDDYNDGITLTGAKRPVQRTPNPAPLLGHDRRLHKGAASLDRQRRHKPRPVTRVVDPVNSDTWPSRIRELVAGWHCQTAPTTPTSLARSAH